MGCMTIISDWRSRDTITVEEAGGILGLGRSASYAAIRRGDIPCKRIGRRYVVPVRAFARFLDE